MKIWRNKDIRNGLLFILFVLTVFRVVAHIPVPGIDASALTSIVNSNQYLGLINVLSGGTLKNFSVVALGVAPYITASIIFQLLGMIFPSMEEMQKEEQGRQKINTWTRWATVPLAALQSFALLRAFGQQGPLAAAGFSLTGSETIVAIVSMVAGTIFLMWLGELISEKKLGNGLSILIFAGIIASLPSFLAQTIATYDSSQFMNMLILATLGIVMIAGVVLVSEAVRNISVQYARGGSQKVTSNLPLRVNMGGMIPIIFALSLLTMPSLVAQFFVSARTAIVADIAKWIIAVFGNQLFYGAAYFLLVFMFTFFYASIIFRPEQVAENLQKQGGFIPGVRPGDHTTKYLQWVVNRILLVGAAFLGLIAVLPVIVQQFTGNQNLVIGGSSVIIVVSVVIDMIKQVESQLTMHEYEV